jgi:hypothetical protein
LNTSFLREGTTMLGKRFFAGMLTAAGVLAWVGASQGGDTVLLVGGDKTPTVTLQDDGQGAQTIRTWHHGGWGYHGGWGHHGGWGYRGFGWGGYNRPFYGGWGGYYRPFYGLGLYRPYYGLGLGYGGFYRPYYGFGWGYGYSGFYPSFGFGYGGFYGPCAATSANIYTLSVPAAAAFAPQDTPLPQPRSDDGTYPYDGGPQQAVPAPRDTPPTRTEPQRTLPLEGRAVSLPKATKKWSYPAYGETARRTVPASDRPYLTRGDSK